MNLFARGTAMALTVTAAITQYFSPCRNLERDGYCLITSLNDARTLKSAVLSQLPVGYHFLNYKYTITGYPLITYHRDVTSCQTSFNTTYPTYTAIHYNYAGDFLSVAEGSHVSWTLGLPVTLGGKKNTVILFNADLVHAGVEAPPEVARVATQYKIAHLDDFQKLEHLQDISMTQTGKVAPQGLFSLFLRVASYVCTVPIQMFARSLLQERQAGLAGYLQRLFPLQYFNKA